MGWVLSLSLSLSYIVYGVICSYWHVNNQRCFMWIDSKAVKGAVRWLISQLSHHHQRKHPTDLLQDPQHHRNNQTMIISRLLKLDTACISVSKLFWKLMNHPFRPSQTETKTSGTESSQHTVILVLHRAQWISNGLLFPTVAKSFGVGRRYITMVTGCYFIKGPKR